MHTPHIIAFIPFSYIIIITTKCIYLGSSELKNPTVKSMVLMDPCKVNDRYKGSDWVFNKWDYHCPYNVKKVLVICAYLQLITIAGAYHALFCWLVCSSGYVLDIKWTLWTSSVQQETCLQRKHFDLSRPLGLWSILSGLDFFLFFSSYVKITHITYKPYEKYGQQVL